MKAHEHAEASELARKDKVPLSASQRVVRRFNDSYPWFRPVAITSMLLAGLNVACWLSEHAGTVNLGGFLRRVNPWANYILLSLVVGLIIWRQLRFNKLLRQEQETPSNICLNCGYDLRSISCDRCPECGEPTG